jgi:hypothetical protein
MHQRHGWNERTEDGEKREVLAVKFGKEWTLQSKLRGEERWTYHRPPLRADLETLLDILRRKYQRRRASWEDVQSVEKLLKELPASTGENATEPKEDPGPQVEGEN